MSNCNNVNFHGVQKIGDSNLLDQLEDNLKSYLDNGFLHIGGWINARRAVDSEPHKLIEKYINYRNSFVSLYEEKFDSLSEPLTEFLTTFDLDEAFRTALLINFDPNLGNTEYDRRLRVIASGTHNGSTLNMLDTGFTTNKDIFNLITPTGYDKLLVYIDPNNMSVPIDIKVSGLDLPTNLYNTVSTPVESREYTLFFDAYGGGKAVDDAKNLILTANSGNSSVLLVDTGYVSGTTKSSLPCIPTGVSENTESYTFTKPAGYDSITIDYSQHNKYDNSFYYKIEYTDTYNPPASLYGDLPHQLKTTEVNGYKIGQVWQAFKKDWVWETGVEYYPDPKYCENFSPINISGIYVNNNFLPGPTGVATSGYHINYPLGQIIFDKAIPKTSKVELNYSYRWCQVYKSSSDSSWKELQELTYSPNPSLNQPSAGDYSISANHRAQMPCIIIEPASRTSAIPYQLGDYSQYQSQDFLLHIFTENSVDKNRICDIIRLQKDQIISLYDINKVVNFGVQPLNYDGSANPKGLSYIGLLSDYYWNKTMFKDFSLTDMESKNKNIYWCIIRLTSETIT